MTGPALRESRCAPRLMIGVTDNISTCHIHSSGFLLILSWIGYIFVYCEYVDSECVQVFLLSRMKTRVQPTETLHVQVFLLSCMKIRVQPTETPHHIR